MILPFMEPVSTSRSVTEVFKGYNHNLKIADGEFFDEENMTGDYFPILSPRGPRGLFASPDAPTGMIAKDALCYTDGTDFVINGKRINMGLNSEQKQLVSMGAYVIILPDKKYINTSDLSTGNIEAETTTNGTVTFTNCKSDGNPVNEQYSQDSEPTDPTNQTFWVDTSVSPSALKQYSETTRTWVTIQTTYVKIECPNIGQAFDQWDGISISGLLGELHGPDGDIIPSDELRTLNGAANIFAKGRDYIVIVGIVDKAISISDPVTISRKMPIMDYVVESRNRLFGCHYGINSEGKFVNEIYVSKLGSFKNWQSFRGISTDSYIVSLGSDGPFTGAITVMGVPTFFKENVMHRVYGYMPANFSLQETECDGVAKGSSKSIAIVGNDVIYQARKGICIYDGSLPRYISGALGEVQYHDGVAAALGNKYYISTRDSEGWNVFVLDTTKGMWHREDSLHADSFCEVDGELYAIDHETRRIITMRGSGTPFAKPVTWAVQTGELTEGMVDMKYISRLLIRLVVPKGSRISFYVQYDLDKEWTYMFDVTGTDMRSFSLPVRPRRCDFLRLMMVGIGDAKIYSIAKTIEKGSDIS